MCVLAYCTPEKNQSIYDIYECGHVEEHDAVPLHVHKEKRGISKAAKKTN